FDAVVPREVIVAAVAIVLVVVLVVLLVVGHQILEGEAVVGGDEVHRAERPATALVEQVTRGRQAGGEIGELAVVAFPECTYGVAELVVPFRPARREAANLVAAGAAVPRLGDQLGLGQYRVLATSDEEAVALVEAFMFAAEDGGQVEAETIDMHLGC